MKKTICLIIILIFSTLAFVAQAGTISGVVMDSTRHEPIEYASIRLLSIKDSAYIQGAIADSMGRFAIHPTPNTYILEASLMGYKTHLQKVKISQDKMNLDLGAIYLVDTSRMLGEVTVSASVPDIVVRGDTIEYNADAYVVSENALLQDVVKLLPGVKIDTEGNLTANGKPIKKILVDGKEFFDNDIQMALKNLPANMIKKLQLFKEESETSKITGFKDGNEEQVLNLKIKEEFKNSAFGELKVGYGSNNKYANKAMLNYMRGDNQFSVVGNMDNIGGDFNFGGEFFSPYSGVDKEKYTGGSFSLQQSEKFKVGGSVRYSDNTNVLESATNTEYFSPNYKNKNESFAQDNKIGVNLGLNLEWKPDSLTSIYFRSSGSNSRSKVNRQTSGYDYRNEQDTTKTTYNENRSQGNGLSLSNSLIVGRKLNSKGRTISLMLVSNIRNDDSDGSNLYRTTYKVNAADSIVLTDQFFDTKNKQSSLYTNLSFVEPIDSKRSIMLAYSFRNAVNNRSKNSFKKDGIGDYTLVDTAYTRQTKSASSNHGFYLGFQAKHEKLEYSLGLTVDASSSKSKVSVLDSIIDDLKQNVVNYSPAFRFSYKPKKDLSMSMTYNGSTDSPALNQLSKDTIRINTTNITYGNPNLKTAYRSGLMFNFQKSNYESERFLNLFATFNNTLNQIVNYEFVDSLTNRASTYKNVNGNWSANIGATYSTPLKNKKLTLDIGSYTYLTNTLGFINAEKQATTYLSFTQNLGIRFQSKTITTYLRANHSYNITQNSLQTQSDNKTSSYALESQSTLNLPLDLTLINNIAYKYNSGYSADFKKTEILWNVSLAKAFLKQKKGTLTLQCFDILKDRNNVVRTVTTNISDMRTNAVIQYFLLSFSYRLNMAGGESSAY